MPSEDNVADAAFKGVDPHALKDYSLSWSASQWLVTNNVPEQRQFYETKNEVKRTSRNVTEINPEQKTLTMTESKSTKVIFDLIKQNSFEKSLRVVATVKRVISLFK